ncbi:hypothetical protein [Rhodococcus sp. WAY2]|uniref:hypothetical protein n=1 Tax=Rhodococcus sp. WAY2 TaxID=2663121 RepID=UPI001F28F7BB|nr:hypothetical protein [Rhodococcus sp. WAY2]
MNQLRSEIHSGEFQCSRHYPVSRRVEDAAAQAFMECLPGSEWPPVNTQFADVFRLAAWRLLVPIETVAALDCSTLTGLDWSVLAPDAQSEWIDRARASIARLTRMPHWKRLSCTA